MGLGAVDDQLTDVGDYHVPSHVIGPHDDSLYPLLLLLLPGDFGPRSTRHITQEAGCVADIYQVVGGAADHDRWLRLRRRWDGGLKGSSGGSKSGHLGQRGAGVRPGQMVAAGDHSEGDALGARLCIHVALVVVGHAIGGTGEMGLPLTAVPAFTHRLTVPDVTFRSLLGAHEAGAGGLLGHSHRAFFPIHISGCHTAPVPTHI